VRRDVAILGSDRSASLVAIAMRHVRSLQGTGGAVGTDAFIADGMALPYRPASMDGVLCIAVLHHISSPERRVRFLEQLRGLLVPGGRAIVTVWATAQENPAKTLNKWTSIRVPTWEKAGRGAPVRAAKVETSEPPPPGAGVPIDTTAEMHRQAGTPAGACADATNGWCAVAAKPAVAEKQVEETAGGCESAEGAGFAANYFVPWQMPFHRAGPHLARLVEARKMQGRGEGATSSQLPLAPAECGASEGCTAGAVCKAVAVGAEKSGVGAAGDMGSIVAPALQRSGERKHTEGLAVGEVHPEKQTVVFKRYYHLFKAGELAGLVAHVAGVQLCSEVYDASNWVAVFERLADEL
jgi:hypothetical protein